MCNTICYVDGLNLYYGLRVGNWRNYLWLDIPLLAQTILRRLHSRATLVAVKYFSAPMLADPARERRQATYVSAIQENPLVTVHWGIMRETTEYCPLCSQPYKDRHEKEADTGIAAEIVKDACLEKPNAVLLIAGDTDYVPALRILKKHFPFIMTIVAKPPNRGPCDDLRQYCDKFMRIREELLRSCQLPLSITTTRGVRLVRPPTFKWP